MHSFNKSFIHSFIHLFIHTFIQSFIHSFIHEIIKVNKCQIIQAQLTLLFIQEEEKSSKLQESMSELDLEMKRTNSMLYKMIPKTVADRLRNGEPTVDTCEVRERECRYTYSTGSVHQSLGVWLVNWTDVSTSAPAQYLWPLFLSHLFFGQMETSWLYELSDVGFKCFFSVHSKH